jgi:transcriptional regulator with PAS, ATPase and Fis domain
MRRILELIPRLANLDSTVLITGESGTGKELAADAIHTTGFRAKQPLVKVNCSALPENLLESELFGHVRGAFTGAFKDKTGRFQRAEGGTIFLDEIGDISPRLQLALLRVLQQKEFERVGDSRPVRVDVRVLAATNQDLMKQVKRGKFREDLYYRLRVVELKIPPLRERMDDLPLLIDHFLRRSRGIGAIEGIAPEVMELFMAYHWPGNIRELEHALEHCKVHARQSVIQITDLPLEIRVKVKKSTFQSSDDVTSPELIIQALIRAGGNKAKAARLLGVDRSTLYRKMSEHGITDIEDV